MNPVHVEAPPARVPTLQCPHCSRRIDDKILLSAVARRRTSFRKAGAASGKAKIPANCPRCGAPCDSKRAARDHCRKPRIKQGRSRG